MPDRKQIPPIKQIYNLKIKQPTCHKLDNGIPVYEISLGTQEIIKLEIVFKAGRPYENKKMAARATARMLKEGTALYSSSKIAEMVDFYGGTLSLPVNLDTSNIVLYALSKHFDKLLPLVAEMILNPAFPEKELDIFKENNLRQLEDDLSKNDVLAYRQVTESIFGKEHPYGYNSQAETYRSIERKDILEHYDQNYGAENCIIFINGKTTPAHIELLNQFLGKIPNKSNFTTPQVDFKTPIPGKLKISKPESIQTAIRIGRKLFCRNHKDYNGFYVLNAILGGYFGSRLMTNIREEKGYTYNIFSTIDPMIFDGCFYIGTEVGNDFSKSTIEEIYKEIALLRSEPIEEEEMEMVRNYLMGNLLNMIDGAFNVGEVARICKLEGLPFDAIDTLIKEIKTIQPERIMKLANQYLKEEDLWEVVVGP